MKRWLFSLLILLFISTSILALPTAKLTIKVVNEAGNPIEGADVGLVFILPGDGLSTNPVVEKGTTDSNGLFTGSGESPRSIRYGATKEDYYRTSGKKFRMDNVTGIFGFRRWQPWNPTVKLVLKKKINPIALYARNMESLLSRKWINFPVVNAFVSYDLVARDWVVPHGQGTHHDFLLKLVKHRAVDRGDYDITLTVKFSNEGDGIQSYYSSPRFGSDLRLPHNAPTSGYKSELIINRKRSKDGEELILTDVDNREDQNYFFRVRTEKDEQGNIVSALYGKMHGGFDLKRFVKKGTIGKLRFSYYLNPTPKDTNLEFDTRKNLFTDLRSLEKVRLP